MSNSTFCAHQAAFFHYLRPILFAVVLPAAGSALAIFEGSATPAAVGGMLALAGSVLYAATLRKGASVTVSGGTVTLRRGFLIKRISALPVRNISHITGRRALIGRIFGFRRVSFFTRASKKPLCVLHLSETDFVLLKKAIFTVEETVVAQNTRFDALRWSAVTSTAFSGLLFAVPALNTIGKMLGISLYYLLFREAERAAAGPVSFFGSALDVITLIAAILYMVSFVLAALGRNGFILSEGSNAVETSGGVWPNTVAVYRKSEIPAYFIKYPPSARLMKTGIFALGLYYKRQKGNVTLTGEKFAVKEEGVRVLPEPSQLTRYLKPSFLICGILIIAVCGLSSAGLLPYGTATWLYTVCLAAMLLLTFSRYEAYTRGGITVGDGITVAFRRGISLKISRVPADKCGGICISRDFSDKKRGTCTLRIIAAGPGKNKAVIKYLSEKEVRKLLANNRFM